MLYPISAPIPNSTGSVRGYIDGHGKVVIEPRFAGCSHFFEGVAAVMLDEKKSQFIDLKGSAAMPFEFSGLVRFCDGLCGVGAGYVDHSGEWIIEPQFVVTGEFSEGLAFVSRNGQDFYFIDFSGRPIGSHDFRQCRPYSEGLAAVRADERWGYVDRRGNIKIPSVFEGSRATSFRYGVAGVQIDGRWGFVDHSGRFVIQPQFEDLRPFNDYLAPVQSGSKWGIVDRDGREVVACTFDEVGRYDGGLAPARFENKAGYLSADGRWAIGPAFDKSYAFFGELAIVRRGNTYSYINRRGEIVWTSEPWASVQYPPPPVLV